MRALVAIAVLGLALPAGAGTRSQEFKRVARTARVTYYAAKGRSIDIKSTELFLDRLAALFGPAPIDWRLDYYLHDSPHVVQPDLGLAAYGVTDLDRLRIDSVRAFHPHELVHAMTARLGSPPVFFAEGLAVALTGQGAWRGEGLDQLAVQALAASRTIEPYLERFAEQDPKASYAVAGSLVGYLLDRFGVDAFIAFLGGCDSPAGRYEAAFQRAYGRTLTRASHEWQQWLREGSSAARAWYDAASWPGSLRRAGATLTADSRAADVLTVAAVAEVQAPRAAPAMRGQVLDLEESRSPSACSNAPATAR